MANEKRELIRKIEDRRVKILSGLTVSLLWNAFLAWLLDGHERALAPEELRMLPFQEQQDILEGARSCEPSGSKVCGYTQILARVISGETPRRFFGMSYQNVVRLYLSAPLPMFVPIAYKQILDTPLYKRIASPDGTTEELKTINQREKDILKLSPLFLVLLTVLEATTNLEIPYFVFLISLILSIKGVGELIDDSVPDLIKNKSLHENSVFFKTTRGFIEHPRNQEICDLMENGKARLVEGRGFFLRDPSKGFDLTAKIDEKRFYFAKEVDKFDGQITYSMLENKPERPGRKH